LKKRTKTLVPALRDACFGQRASFQAPQAFVATSVRSTREKFFGSFFQKRTASLPFLKGENNDNNTQTN
jgi:hypothetical protein